MTDGRELDGAPGVAEAASSRQLPLVDGGVLYDQRFMDAHVGRVLLNDPVSALVELVANCWDAGATDVDIEWPESVGGLVIVRDNGTGMTDAEFQVRWRTMNYNRRAAQGEVVVFPNGAGVSRRQRVAFGRNGIGRWAAFCFGNSYLVDTARGGFRNRYRVTRGAPTPFEVAHEVSDEPAEHHGTTISVAHERQVPFPEAEIRSEIGMRFLSDPAFNLRLNGGEVTLQDITGRHIRTVRVEVDDGNVAELIVIDTHATDRTSQQKGVAWHVGGRLVGKCSWAGPREEAIIDRRRIAARRFTFIVRADHLAAAEAVKSDWSGFDEDNEVYQRTANAVYEVVEHELLNASEADREHTLGQAKHRNRRQLETMPPLSRERWITFVNEAQERCPRVREDDILRLSEVMANLEAASSGYRLLHQLAALGPDDLDELNQILSEWTLDMAKIVLDEIAQRLKLVEELQVRVRDEQSREVQDLQPVFKRGLWIFGPEFETIEYTSNSGMTRVIRELFQSELEGSLLRPDFVVLPDSTVGLYAYPRYDSDGGEDGVERLVVVELKRPGVRIGSTEKDQCWRYVKELLAKGLISEGTTRVTCFLLGSEFDPQEMRDRTEGPRITIRPMPFEQVLERARSRMFRLQERVQDAPFLQEHRAEIALFLEPLATPSAQPSLLEELVE